ncbi:transcription initiation factor TFIID subunit 4-like isoform X2 [Gadus chalcogrammus]|uniref:transcription initiation factor TFIID subunit 4-like isoform X2 n=1 Tax=Gadus chalcogrammus TaxID=1042646 RepID=UPI0024C4D785|nr:transcription initiation factor TFIID subunit 4-like isoform X2 [Gadus chalcogrammus]
MNAHTSGRAAPVTSDSTSNTSTMTAITSGSVLSKGNAIRTATSSNSVIQTHFTNSQNVAASTQPASQERGPMMTAMRTPMQGTGPSDTNMDVTLNGPNNTAGPTLVANAAGQIAPSAHTSVRAQTPLVNNGQLPAAAVSLGVGSHIIRAEPPKQIIQTLPQQGLPLGSVIGPRHVSPVALAPSPGGMRAPTQQLLAPRLPQTPAGQPNLQNFQLPPGMVLVRSESGQLLMIHQQALAQMQAQAAAAPRPATPTAMPLAQAPGIPMSSRPMGPGSMVRQASPVAPTTTLHRPPVLQSSGGPVPPGSATSTSPETTVAPPTSGPISNETMENVKKCRNFLSTLIKLASTGKQSAQTAENVKELVKELLEGKLEAEDFTSKLYSELNSSPQPYLVPFLKRSLPALRQLTPNAALFAQQSHVPRPTASTPPPAKQPSSPATVVLRSPAPHLTTAVTRPQVQPDISRPGPVNQTLLQPQPLAVGMRPPVNMATAPMVTPRTQSPGKILVGPQQLRQLTSGPPGRTGLLPVFKSVPPAAASLAQKNHLKEAGGTFKDEDDINDVASMAGVNLTEESARILATNSELVGAVTHSCKDEAFLSTAVLQRRMLEIGKKFGVSELGVDVVTFVSHATQQSLQNLLEKVTQVAQHKNFSFKEESSYEGSSDVRAQLRFFEQLDQLEKQRKEGQERQILLKAAKSRARQEDPEQLRLKQKAKEMQQQELAMMRQKEANLTALAAIGPRKPRKPADASASAGAAEGSGSGSSLGAGSSGSRPTRQRITRINLKDLLFCLETERPTAHSQFLYKGFLK